MEGEVLAYVEITASPGKQRSSQPWLKARGWPWELREASMAPPSRGAAASHEETKPQGEKDGTLIGKRPVLGAG